MGPAQPDWLDRLDADHENVRAALAWSQAPDGAPATGIRLAGALWRYWALRGYLAEADAWLERTTRPAGLGAGSLAKALAGAAFIANFRGDTAQALHLCQRGLRLARDGGDERLAAFILSLQGESLCQNGDFVPGAAALAESLALARQSGDRWLIAFSLTQTVELASRRHDLEHAAMLAEECLSVARQVADRWLVAFALFRTGSVATDRGQYPVARALHEEGLALRRQMGDPLGIAYALLGLANVAEALGDYAAALALTEERLAIERELQHTLGVAHVLNNLGWMAYNQDDLGRAIECYQESLALCRQLANHWCVATQLYHLGWINVDRGAYEQAAALFQEGLAICAERGLRGYIRPILVGGLGRLAYCQGDYASAWARYVERLVGFQEIGDEEGMLSGLIGLGTLAAHQSRLAEAVRLWGTAEAHPWFNRVLAHLRPRERQEYRAAAASAQAALGEASVEAARRAGHALTLAQAIEYALSTSDI
jgi:tetratricopeptide (TPR) repeat protein